MSFRIDSAVEQGGEVSPFYDPMIAKLIAHAPTRDEAATALAEACAEVEVWPVRTNAGFLVRCLEHPDFVAGEVDTAFIPSRVDSLTATNAPAEGQLVAAAKWLGAPRFGEDYTPWHDQYGLLGFRLNAAAQLTVRLEVNGRPEAVRIGPGYRDAADVWGYLPTAEGVVLFDGGEAYEHTLPRHSASAAQGETDGAVLSPMPGRIVAAPARAGEAVTRGQPLVVLEAMKMEHALTAPFDGVVAELNATVGEQVSEGVLLARVEAQAS